MAKKIAIGIIIILALVLVYGVFIAPEREKNSRINEAIYTRFREIENYCLAYVSRETVNQAELERCKEVVEKIKFCDSNATADQVGAGCYADEYYKGLQKIRV